jgi:hypothetical protein
MRTSALKRGAKHSERDDRERRNYPPAPLRRINAAIQTPAESNLPPQLRQFARFSMCKIVTRRRCGGQLADLLGCRESRDPLLSISCEPCQPELGGDPIGITNRQHDCNAARPIVSRSLVSRERRREFVPRRPSGSSQLLVQARSNLASNPEQTDAPLNATRSLSSRVSPDGLRLAHPPGRAVAGDRSRALACSPREDPPNAPRPSLRGCGAQLSISENSAYGIAHPRLRTRAVYQKSAGRFVIFYVRRDTMRATPQIKSAAPTHARKPSALG